MCQARDSRKKFNKLDLSKSERKIRQKKVESYNLQELLAENERQNKASNRFVRKNDKFVKPVEIIMNGKFKKVKYFSHFFLNSKIDFSLNNF